MSTYSVDPASKMTLEQTFEEASGPMAAADATAGPRPRSTALGWSFWLSVGWLALVAVGALFAPILPLHRPGANTLLAPNNQGPSLHYLLGTDNSGGDVFSSLVYGARVSLVVGLGSVAIGLLLGGMLGLIAGYYGKAVDFLSNSVALIFLSFPQLVLILGTVTFLGHSLTVITITLGVVATPLIFRIVRATTQSYAQREFVQAARALGAKTSRIILREVLPNVAMTALSFIFIGVGVAIIAEAALAFLGQSVQPPTPTWGYMVNVGTSNLNQNKILWLWPTLALLFTILSLNVAGDKLRTRFGVKDSFL